MWFFHLPEAREVGVGLGGPAGGVHDLDGPDLVPVLLQQGGDALLQFPVLEGRELVEDPAEEGKEEGDEQQKQGGKRREGQDQPVPEALVEAHDHGGEAYHEPELQEELLDLVPGEGLGLGAIEAVLLLDVHGVVPGEGDEGQGRQSAEEHHREQLTPVVPGEQPGEGGVGVGQDQYEVDDEAGRGGEHAEADLFPMIGLPLQIGVPVVHVRHVLRDGVPGGASAEDVQCQPVQVYRAQDGDGDDLIVHSVSSRFVL